MKFTPTYRAAALYSYVVTVAAATFVITRSRRSEGLAVDWVEVAVWQGSSYGLWLPVGFAVWRLLSGLGLSLRSGKWLMVLGFVAVIAHGLAAAGLDAHFSVKSASYATLVLGRLPIDLLVYMVIAAALWSAFAHRNSMALHRALAVARSASARAADRERNGDVGSKLILVSVGNSQAPVRISSIEWIGAAGNYVVINWDGREGLLRSTLKSFEHNLDADVFVRAHRSTLVNLAKVASASSLAHGSWRLTMESGAELVASRTYRDQILGRLGRR